MAWIRSRTAPENEVDVYAVDDTTVVAAASSAALLAIRIIVP